MRGLREFTESVGQAVLDGVGRVASRVQERKPLPADLLESEDAYLVVFDAPGATLEDVQVRYESGGVHVRIDRFREFHEGYDMRFPGRGLSLTGRADLPDDAVVDPKGATATLGTDGTLRIEVPKSDDRDGTRVSVETGETEEHGQSSGAGAEASPTASTPDADDDSPAESTTGSVGDEAGEGAGDAERTSDGEDESPLDADDDSALDAGDHDPDVKEPRTDE